MAEHGNRKFILQMKMFRCCRHSKALTQIHTKVITQISADNNGKISNEMRFRQSAFKSEKLIQRSNLPLACSQHVNLRNCPHFKNKDFIDNQAFTPRTF